MTAQLPEHATTYLFDPATAVDLTLGIYSGMPASFRETPVTIRPRYTHVQHGYAATTITIGSHTGTHIDAPYHFLPDGDSVDRIPLSTLVTAGRVLDCRNCPRRLDRDTLTQALNRIPVPQGFPAVILWTGWDQHIGQPEMHAHPYLTEEAAGVLIELGTNLVGIDATGVDDSLSNKFPVHRLLLAANVPIVENLCNLSLLGEGLFLFAFLPLPIIGGDAAQVRAVAWRLAPAPSTADHVLEQTTIS